MITVIEINGRKFLLGKDFLDVKIKFPTQEEPYWRFELYFGKHKDKTLYATGQVTVKKEEVTL